MIFENKPFTVPSRPTITASQQRLQQQQQQQLQQQQLQQFQQQQFEEQQQQQLEHHQAMSTSESESSIDDILDMLSKQTGNFINSSLFFYPPSSGIAPCVGTAGTVHDTYT